jgi:hypothetical protein
VGRERRLIVKLIFDDPDTLEGKIDQLNEEIEAKEERIDEQEGIIEEAEALSESLGDELSDLIQDRNELRELLRDEEFDTIYDVMFGESKVLGRDLGWDKWCSVVRDPHEKLRFSDADFPVLVLMGDTVWGCEDYVPCQDSELIFLAEGLS